MLRYRIPRKAHKRAVGAHIPLTECRYMPLFQASPSWPSAAGVAAAMSGSASLMAARLLCQAWYYLQPKNRQTMIGRVVGETYKPINKNKYKNNRHFSKTPTRADCDDLGDRAKQPSALSRTLTRALNITVTTVIAGQVKPIRTTVARKSQ